MSGRMVPVVALAATGALAAAPAWAGSTTTLTTSLTGAEVPTVGDTDASGSATLVLDKAAKRVCYQLGWSAVDGSVTAAHVHVAPAGQTGPHFVDLFNGVSLPGTGSTSGCVTATAAQVSALIKNPTAYYVNLHSSAFPAGAVRGQLGD